MLVKTSHKDNKLFEFIKNNKFLKELAFNNFKKAKEFLLS